MTAADIRLFLAGYVLSALLCTIMMAFLWWQNRKRSPEIIFWLANFIAQFAGVLLFTFRGLLPDFLTIVVANILIIGGSIVLYIGLCRYTGKECRQLHNYLLLAVFTLVHLFLTYVHPNFNLRVVNISIAFIFICAQSAWLLLRRVEPDLRLVTKVTGVIFSLLCLLSLSLIIVSLFKPIINDFLLSGFHGIFTILTYQIAFIALSIALFLMVNRRLSMALESEIFQRAQEEELIRLRLSLLEFAVTHSREEVLQQTLDEVGTLVYSPIGFYHFVENDQKTLSLQAWSTRTLKEFCKATGKGLHYGIDQAGVWVDCVHEKRTVIHNDYHSLPHRKGMPEGHASVIRELVVPITRGEKIVAVLGVGNKPVNYTEKDAEIVSYLADVAWEITQRKMAEQALRESEAFRKRVFESSRIPIIIMDVVTSKYIDCNPAATEMYGFSSREETLGKTPLDVSAPVQYDNTPSPEKVRFYIEKGLADGMVVFEWRHRRPDGEIWDAEVHLMNFQSGDRHLMQFSLQDITERKRVESELLHIKKAVESTSDAIGISDPQGRHIYQNKAFTELFEYTLAEIKDAGGGQAVYADKNTAGEVFETIMNGKSWSGDVEMISRSGHKLPIALHADAIKDESGQIVGLIGLHTDITRRKKAEWTLQERFKELNCLYGISALMELPDISLEELLQKTAFLLPPAWQYPEITGARITAAGQIFQTELFRETAWMQSHSIMVHGKPAGQVEVCYLEKRQTDDQGLFLIEERQLIKAIAERLGRFIEFNRAQEQIRLNETRLTSLLNIMQYRTKTTQEFLDYALDEIIKLTQSKIGYIYFYNEDNRQFVLNTWSKDVMKECSISNPQTCYDLEKTGIWGEAVRQRKPIILNDFQADHPLKKGYPEGHAYLNKFLTIPVFKNSQIVAVVGVANKAEDYDETDVLQLTLFMDSVWKSVDIKMSEENLRKSEERFKQLAEVFPETIFEADMEGNITYANEHGLDHFGFMEEDIAKGLNIYDLVAPNHRKLARERILERIHGASKGYLEYQALKKDGSIFHALALSVPIMVEGAPAGIRGFILDITERMRSEEALRESEERYRFITDHTADHIWTTDLSLNFIYSSPAVTKILGYTVEEFMKLEIDRFFTPESLATMQKALMEELDKDPGADPNRIRTIQSEHYHKNGHLIWLESSLTFIRDKAMKPAGILGVSRDITERKIAEEQIEYLATHDLLTDLPSLRLAKDRLTMAMNRARRNKTPMAVMFIDLDGFKTVNDTLGHDAGDYVLQQVAQRMLSCVRETDTVARVGGDEFLIIAAEISTPENAAQIAEKVIQTVSQQIPINEQQRAVVGTSIGIALFPDHGEDMDRLIKLADEAMYKVKNTGKNGFRFAKLP